MTDDKKYIDKIITGMFCHTNIYFLAKSSIRAGRASDNTIMELKHFI